MRAITKARQLRRDETRAETLFWNCVRNRQFKGLKWKRQVPIDRFIADFMCESEKLIVELDGDSHDLKADYDETRTQVIETYGYRVIRFWNDDVLDDIDGIMDVLALSVGQSHA